MSSLNRYRILNYMFLACTENDVGNRNDLLLVDFLSFVYHLLLHVRIFTFSSRICSVRVVSTRQLVAGMVARQRQRQLSIPNCPVIVRIVIMCFKR